MIKNCLDCNHEFIKRGANHKRCDSCASISQKQRIKKWKLDNVVIGCGSGAKPEQLNPNYRHGKSTFDRWSREKKMLLGSCERCSKDISSCHRHGWAGHHKDHNHLNNVKENLEILCTRCHQIEHQCWKNFEGVTTIPKGSTA